MSFITVAKKVLSTILGVEHYAAVAVSFIDPELARPAMAIDKFVTDLQTSISKQELTNPVDGQGKLKAANVSADIDAGLLLSADAAGVVGYSISYDDQIKQQMIDKQVQAYNLEQEVYELGKQFKASIKFVKNPTSVPAPAK